MIVLLILAVMLSTLRIIFNQTAHASGSQQNTSFIVNENKDKEFKNLVLYKVLHQVFPAGGLNKENNIQLLSFKDAYESIVKEIIFIDFKNPLTFIRPQFPAIALYNYNSDIHPGITSPIDNKVVDENNDYYIIDPGEDKSIAVTTPPPQDTDDRGEREEGIYLPGEFTDIVDSRDVDISLDDIVKPKSIKLEKGKPQILIYHTHGTESYKPASEGNFHTLRKEYSVMEIGEIIASELTKRGYEVIHDTTYHDYPSYNGSYTRSLSTVQEILKKNPSIKVVLDIHRDGYDNIDTNPLRETLIKNNQVTIKNEVSSKFQFVIGPETQNKKAVETFAQYVKAVSDQMHPNLSKPVLLKPYGKFNQFVADHYLLVEVGSNANTIDEAKKAGGYFADVLAAALKEITE